MTGAVATREKDAFEPRTEAMSRAEVLARYRHLREMSGRHQQEAVNLLSHDAVLSQARRLGLAIGRTLIIDDVNEFKYVLDLAIHTAPPGRTRAIDRYARAARFVPESDEARMLEAMRNSQFVLFRVERRHETAGLIVTDLVRRKEIWLVDEGMESTSFEGDMFATRIYTLDFFSMTAGAGVLFDAELLEDLRDEVPQLTRKSIEAAVDDRRFAEAVFRIAIESGLTERIGFQDPLREAG
jgi:hypothetical protein